MTNVLVPGKTIGILGGGQLGRMMALSAREMGFQIAVLDPGTNSPCGQIADIEILATYDDLSGAKELLEVSDVLTYEFENINSLTTRWIEKNGNLPQGSRLLEITQHRGKEKTAVESFGIEVSPYRLIYTYEDLEDAVLVLGLPAVLKTCTGGYDGKGQFVIREQAQIREAYNQLRKSGELVLEKWLKFDKEVSVIVSRNSMGEIKTYPTSENIHTDNILHITIAPARISNDLSEKAEKIAVKLAESFELIGTLAVEMFLTEDGDIFVNELAPRPHNSGHYTINACETSQFEQHIRAICNWPLGKTNLLKPAVMVNILGEHLQQVVNSIPKLNDFHLHLYGKAEAKKGRKMGHLTVLADTVEEALEKIHQLGIWN